MALFLGAKRIALASTASTNDDLKALAGHAATRPPEGTLIWALEQTQGRGQLGALWHSIQGESLTCSILFCPNFLVPAEAFRLNVAVALGLLDLGRALLPDASDIKLKWPNDLLVNGRKMGGVLIENSLSANRIETSVVGIGLNVNERDFPEGLPPATSLALESGHSFALEGVIDSLCDALERRYLQLRAGQWTALKDQYGEQLYRRGIWSNYRLSETDEVFEGLIEGVSESGHLHLRTRDGNVQSFAARTLRYV